MWRACQCHSPHIWYINNPGMDFYGQRRARQSFALLFKTVVSPHTTWLPKGKADCWAISLCVNCATRTTCEVNNHGNVWLHRGPPVGTHSYTQSFSCLMNLIAGGHRKAPRISSNTWRSEPSTLWTHIPTFHTLLNWTNMLSSREKWRKNPKAAYLLVYGHHQTTVESSTAAGQVNRSVAAKEKRWRKKTKRKIKIHQISDVIEPQKMK